MVHRNHVRLVQPISDEVHWCRLQEMAKVASASGRILLMEDDERDAGPARVAHLLRQHRANSPDEDASMKVDQHMADLDDGGGSSCRVINRRARFERGRA